MLRFLHNGGILAPVALFWLDSNQHLSRPRNLAITTLPRNRSFVKSLLGPDLDRQTFWSTFERSSL
jgi:hypothetical protein